MRGRVAFSSQTPAGVRKSVFRRFSPFAAVFPHFCRFSVRFRLPRGRFRLLLRFYDVKRRSPRLLYRCGAPDIPIVHFCTVSARSALVSAFRLSEISAFRARTLPKAFPRITFFGTPLRFVVPAFCSVSPLFRAAFHSRFPSVFAPRFPFPFLPLFRPSCNPVSRPGLHSFFTPVFRPFFRSVFDPFPAPFSHAFAADVFAV